MNYEISGEDKSLVNEFWWEITYVAKYIAKGLGYHYPDETEKAVNEYCKSIHDNKHKVNKLTF